MHSANRGRTNRRNEEEGKRGAPGGVPKSQDRARRIGFGRCRKTKDAGLIADECELKKATKYLREGEVHHGKERELRFSSLRLREIALRARWEERRYIVRPYQQQLEARSRQKTGSTGSSQEERQRGEPLANGAHALVRAPPNLLLGVAAAGVRSGCPQQRPGFAGLPGPILLRRGSVEACPVAVAIDDETRRPHHGTPTGISGTPGLDVSEGRDCLASPASSSNRLASW